MVEGTLNTNENVQQNVDNQENMNVEPKTEEVQQEAAQEMTASTPEVNSESPAEAKQKHYEELFEKLKDCSVNGKSFDVKVSARIRGGLRVMFEDMPLFLPASHFCLKKNPTEDELAAYIGKDVTVMIHELQEEENRKTVIVSRKKLLEEDFWSNIKVGDKVKGSVSSIAKFGIFIDLGGIEGLIHISRLSQMHIGDPKDVAKKGDELEAVVVEIDRENSRIALSRKELEPSPWSGITQEFEIGSVHKGIVRRFTDFGAYIELRKGIDGLLRNSELSWTKRIQKPAAILEKNQEIEVKVVAISEEKQTMALSVKQLSDNPWPAMKEKFEVGSELNGTISQVVQQGIVVTVDGDIDGFMPRSKMTHIPRGAKLPYNVGDAIEVLVADLVIDEESLILQPKLSEEQIASASNDSEQRDRRPRAPKKSVTPESAKASAAGSSFSIGDLLSEASKTDLMKKVNN